MTASLNPRLIDLFSGCGGFSLGAHKAGFDVTAAFDIDSILTSSYTKNFPNTSLYLRDVSSLSGDDLRSAAGGAIAGIIGGPPCQGFSTIGKRDPRDPRRKLLDHYFRLVSEAEPSFFVMENVVGLANPNSIDVLNKAIKRVKKQYSLLGPIVLDASEFGAATKRSRLFVIGVHKSLNRSLDLEDFNTQKRPPTTVRCAIGDLLDAAEDGEEDGYDYWKIKTKQIPSPYAKSLRNHSLRFTGHRKTVHAREIVDRFTALEQGATDEIGRHYRLAWNGQCPTLRAGTGSDRGSYQSVRPIHPEFPRVITVREAARLQGFPDSHIFHPTTWHSFRMIGNSVSPVIAERIFSTIKSRLF